MRFERKRYFEGQVCPEEAGGRPRERSLSLVEVSDAEEIQYVFRWMLTVIVCPALSHPCLCD